MTPEILQNQDEDFIQLLNRVDELYFNDYECPESEVDSDVENFKSDNEVDYVEHFVEPSVDDTRDILLRPGSEMTRAVAKNSMVNHVAKSLTWMQPLNFRNIVRKYLKMNLI